MSDQELPAESPKDRARDDLHAILADLANSMYPPYEDRPAFWDKIKKLMQQAEYSGAEEQEFLRSIPPMPGPVVPDDDGTNPPAQFDGGQ